MGGGDLNSKKSWHPNTMKNQERVWKAEQAAAEENKRILELQKESAQERDREELNAMVNSRSDGQQNDTRLNWMYNKPDKKANAEDYLLGKSVDSNLEGNTQAEKEAIPAILRRVAGASMLNGADVQVDLTRKMREDPLLLVRERERAARAALLNNPIHRKKLAELLRQDQDNKKEKSKSKKTKNIDNLLAEKLNSLGGDNNIDIAALLASDESDDSSDSSSSRDLRKRMKKKKDKKSKSKKSKKRKSEKRSDDDWTREKKTKKNSYSEKKRDLEKRQERKIGRSRDRSCRDQSDRERAARLAEMARAGAENEAQRSERVRAQRRAEAEVVAPRVAAPLALPTSLEARLQSNRHYIQRGANHMNEHFARR